MLLQPFDPGRRVLADAQGLGAERPGLDDRVLGLEVEVAHRAEGPVDAERARLGCRNDAGGPRRLEVVQQAERRRGRQLGHARHLLGDAALQVGPDEERPAGPLAEVARERADAGRGAAEDDEAADAGREGGVDLGALVVEAAAAPAQGGEHEPGERRRHAGVTEPSTRGPRAPVAAGRLPGFPASVRKPRNAKASASLASPSKKSWANGTTGRGRTRPASSSTRAGLRAPPPEITNSSPPAGAGGGVQRSMPRATVSAVSAVAVATASFAEPPAPRTSAISRSANSIPKRSRPVLLGGGWSKNGSPRSWCSAFRSGWPRRARSPSWSYAASESTRRVTASITATPGPVSKATAPSITPRRGTHVMFAIPPRLRSRRARSGCPNSITSARGTSGAPCPPAATSRDRKSLTTRTPTRSAITAGSPSCSVARPGSCQIVWPCDAMKATSPGATLAPASSWSAAPAKRSPRATCSIERSWARPRAMTSMIAPRSAAV